MIDGQLQESILRQLVFSFETLQVFSLASGRLGFVVNKNQP